MSHAGGILHVTGTPNPHVGSNSRLMLIGEHGSRPWIACEWVQALCEKAFSHSLKSGVGVLIEPLTTDLVIAGDGLSDSARTEMPARIRSWHSSGLTLGCADRWRDRRRSCLP
jgi:hypothetical protein